MSQEKRHRTRVHAGFEAYVTVGDEVIPVKTKDISLKGALLECSDECLLDKKCELHIPLSPGIRIVIEGEIVRAKNKTIAMAFKEMDELSFTELHRLVQLNAANPDDIDDEMLEIFEKLK